MSVEDLPLTDRAMLLIEEADMPAAVWQTLVQLVAEVERSRREERIHAIAAAGHAKLAGDAHAEVDRLRDKPRRIETVEVVDRVRLGAVVLDEQDHVWRKVSDTGMYPWCRVGSGVQCPADRIALPAVLLWTPEAS